MKTKKITHKPKVLHKRILLHPISIFLLLCAGILITAATYQGYADTITVSATVPAPPVSGPAIITWPHDQDHFSHSIITVIGTCPDQSYVKLYQNSVFVGVGTCESGTFHIQTSLSLGANQLQVKVYNLTDNEGPASPPITVYYELPTSNSAAPLTPNVPTPPLNLQGAPFAPLIVTYEYHYQARNQGELWTWHMGVSGGSPPYKAIITWADGSTSEQNVGTSFTISHIFRAGGSYQPIIQVTDSQGHTASFQLLAVIRPSSDILATSSITLLSEIQSYLWLIWPAYIVILLMIISFWLGEFEVLQKLGRRPHQPRPARK